MKINFAGEIMDLACKYWSLPPTVSETADEKTDDQHVVNVDE